MAKGQMASCKVVEPNARVRPGAAAPDAGTSHHQTVVQKPSQRAPLVARSPRNRLNASIRNGTLDRLSLEFGRALVTGLSFAFERWRRHPECAGTDVR